MNSQTLKKLEIGILKSIFGNSDKYLTSQYDAADLIFESNAKVIIGEHKTRLLYSTSYKDTGFVLEVKKKEALFNKATKYNKKTNIFYINYFVLDEMLVIWDLQKIFRSEVPTYTNKFNKTTASDFNDCNLKVDKEVYYLKVEDAIYRNRLSYDKIMN